MSAIDVMVFISAIEDAREPAPMLSREDAVFLAMVDNVRIPGFCAACRIKLDKGPAAKWCDECLRIRNRIVDALYWHRSNSTAADIQCSVCKCKFPKPRGGKVTRCPTCQKEYRRLRNTERMRNICEAKRMGRICDM
jgi:hypothetical protein